MARLTIVIVNYNVKYYVYQCIDSIFQSSLADDVDVIVVDNHSHDGSVDFISNRFPQVKVIALNHNLGFARANNLALRSARSEYLLLLNPDVVLGNGVLKEAVEFMDSHIDCGGLGLRMLKVDGTDAMESRRGLPTPLTSFYKMIGLCNRFPKHKKFGKYYLGFLPWDEPAEIEVVSGAFFMLRKQALDKIGMLDEDFFMYGEDIDLSYRILKGGYKNFYLPSRILHYKGESTHKSSFRYVHVFYEAMLIFFRKHYGHMSLLLSLPIKIAIYLKAAVALVGMQFDVVRRNLGFVERKRSYMSRYIFIGTENSFNACRRLFESKGMDIEFCAACSATCQDGHAGIDNLSVSCNTVCYVVYDLAAYSYGDILRIFSAHPVDNVEMAFYHPADNIIITKGDVIL